MRKERVSVIMQSQKGFVPAMPAAAIMRCLLVFVSASVILLSLGCGGGSTAVLHNAPPPAASQSVAIALQSKPAPTIFINGSTPLIAVVSNDSFNAGVSWTLTCQVTDCGSLNPRHTDSGKATIYSPPASLSGNALTVNVVAYATVDPTKNVIAQITVTGFAGNLKGKYVFQTRGVDLTGPFYMAGVIVIDGNGGITSGEQTYSDSVMSVFDSISGGTYSLGTDGRGIISITTADQSIGQLGVETFSFVLLSSSQAFLTQVDDPNIPISSNTSSSGTMDLQTSISPPLHGYAFTLTGTDIFLDPMSIGGVMNIDSAQTISGAGSVADQDLAGIFTPNTTVSGSVSDPDSLGMLKFALNASFATSTIELTGYMVDDVHIKLVESDNVSGAGFGSTGGIAIAQGAATGSFTNNSAMAGTYVFGIFGNDLSGTASPASLLSFAGVYTADSSGNLTNGFADEFSAGFLTAVSDSFTGTYALDATGTGRVDTNSSINFDINGPGPDLIFYLTGNGNPPLVLDADASLAGVGAVGTGIAYPAATNVSFNGDYGLTFTQFVSGSEDDVAGQVTVNGTAQTLSGIVDTNITIATLLNTPLTDGFATTSIPNRLTGTLSNEFFTDTGGTALVAYYMIDSSHGFLVETDSALLFGVIASRTPVCQGCP